LAEEQLKVNGHDSLQRFVFEHAPIRGEIIHLDATWRAVLERKDYPAVVRDVLGEMMAAAALLSATIKYDGSLILQVQGDGPVSLLVVECTSGRTMRALAHWSGEVQPMPLARLVDGGRLVITIDPGADAERYQSIVNVEGGTVADTLQDYLSRSEQLDTRLWLAADGAQAAGMLLQRLPGEQDRDAWNRAALLTETITRDELLALPAMAIIQRLYHQEDIRVFESDPVSFRCSCSRERVRAVLRMLGHDEVKAILDELGSVSANCEYCNQHYEFDRVDAEQIFAADLVSQAGPTRH